MGEWKNGDKAFLPVELISLIPSSIDGGVGRFVATECGVRYDIPLSHVFRSIPPSQPAPVDVSAIRVGDEVTVRGVVVSEANPMREKVLVEFHESLSGWVGERLIATHTTAPRPTTLAEFEALPLEVRERLFAEMVKGGVK